MTWLAFGGGLVVGMCTGIVLMALCAIAATPTPPPPVGPGWPRDRVPLADRITLDDMGIGRDQ